MKSAVLKYRFMEVIIMVLRLQIQSIIDRIHWCQLVRDCTGIS